MPRKLLWILGWLGSTIVLSAILTPIGLILVEWFAPGVVPTRRIFNRCLLLSALLLGWPFLRHLGITRWRDVGWCRPNRERWSQFLVGFGGAILVLGMVYGTSVFFGGRTWSGDWTLAIFGWALLFALGVGLVEETVFRGVLFWSIFRLGPGRWGMLLAVNAIFFASVHFFKAPELAEGPPWAAGFLIWREMVMGSWVNPEALWRWACLALLAVLCCGLVVRTTTLWLVAGVHAGLVFTMKMMLAGSFYVPGERSWLWGSDGISGPIPLLVIAVGAGLVWKRRVLHGD